MNWEYDKRGNCTGHVVLGYPRFEAMKELCSQIVEYVLPHNREVKWEFLRVEVWSDSGKVIVFPSANIKFYRIDQVSCQLVFDELSQWFADLEHWLGDDELSRRIDQQEREWGHLFLVAAAASKLRGLRAVLFSSEGELLSDQLLQTNYRDMNLEGINFDDADLTEAMFSGADLYWSSFYRANLSEANFEAADLRGADLKEATLRNANLRRANLGRDNLNGVTHLDGADLCGADLTGARLEGATFAGAKYNHATHFPTGFEPGSHGLIKTD